MPSQDDVKLFEQGSEKPKKKKRFDARDWRKIGEKIADDYKTRKKDRDTREKYWADVDRQCAMEPDKNIKLLPDGTPDQDKQWMSELELPLQAQALEVLTADARRFMFGDPWFEAVAETTPEFLAAFDAESVILGEDGAPPSLITQQNVNKLVEGRLRDLMNQYDFLTRWDKVNAEAFKYGMGVGRARMQTKNVYIHEARGVRKETRAIPVFQPVSIRNTYLDKPSSTMYSAHEIGDTIIADDWIKLESLKIAANLGSSDPDNPEGGWMAKNLKNIEGDKNGMVRVLEVEGDIVVDRSQGSMVLPGSIATIVISGKETKAEGGNLEQVIRFRWRKTPYSSYLLCPYHFEGTDCVYPTSPLEKGRPVQIAATDAINRLMDSGALKIAPPTGYDRTDTYLAQTGGPQIFPNAVWQTTDGVEVFDKIGGDPSVMAEVLSMHINFYAELTGILPARLGAQTLSHTTAYSKEAELERGAVRTIDYVDATGRGPLTRWLYMCNDMAYSSMKTNEEVVFFIEEYGGFVKIDKSQFPERSYFKWSGNDGPNSYRDKVAMMNEGLQMAINLDQLHQNMGGQGLINISAAIEQTLRSHLWTDVDGVMDPEGKATEKADTFQPNPGGATVALQQLGMMTQR